MTCTLACWLKFTFLTTGFKVYKLLLDCSFGRVKIDKLFMASIIIVYSEHNFPNSNHTSVFYKIKNAIFINVKLRSLIDSHTDWVIELCAALHAKVKLVEDEYVFLAIHILSISILLAYPLYKHALEQIDNKSDQRKFEYYVMPYLQTILSKIM